MDKYQRHGVLSRWRTGGEVQKWNKGRSAEIAIPGVVINAGVNPFHQQSYYAQLIKQSFIYSYIVVVRRAVV